MATHLWEVEHPYYCSHGCYCAPMRDTHRGWGSWADFCEEWGSSDPEIQLVFRWDWRRENDGPHNLYIFFMNQHKAAPHSHHIVVTEEDEEPIREWLMVRWQMLRSMLADASVHVDAPDRIDMSDPT